MANENSGSSPSGVTRGRPPKPEGEAMVPVMVKMKPAQKEKLGRLGGPKWIRERIDRAKEPATE